MQRENRWSNRRSTHTRRVERVGTDAHSCRVARDGSQVERFGVSKGRTRLRIDVAIDVVGATEVGPHDRLAGLNGQVGRVVLEAACLYHNAVHVARVVKHAAAIVLGGRFVVVAGK